jgi:hypothetical protein
LVGLKDFLSSLRFQAMRRIESHQRGSFCSSMLSAGNIVSSFACVLALTFGAALSAHAQAVFQTTTNTYTVGSGPQGVAVADLNRDGKPDAIIADTTGNEISVVLSSGSSYTVNSYSTGSGSSPVAVAVIPNYANSGLPAVAVLEQGNKNVTIFTDSSAGVLTAGASYGFGTAPTSIVVADFNHDGFPDLAISYPNGIAVLLGSATGAFTTAAGAAVGDDIVAIAPGYFDNTENLGLLALDQGSKQINIMKGNGAGGFTDVNNYSVGNMPTSVAVADFNDDGMPDFAVTNSGDGTVSVFVGQGSNNFTAVTASPFPAGANVQSIVAADMNNDGYADLVVTDGSNNTLGVLINQGKGVSVGTATNFNQVVQPALSGTPYGIAVGDFNHDGKPDVIVTQNASGTATVLLNNTLASSPLPIGRNLGTENLSYATGNMADAVTVADFNGDGIPDMAVAFFEDYTVQVLKGNGDGTFGAAATYSVGKHPYAIASADLNHDGFPDLVVANEADGTISVLLNNGSGGFSAASGSPITVGTLPTGLAIGDLNGDGIPDIAVANFNSNDVSILIGKGDGTFTPASTPTLAGQTNPYNVVIGDFNGDGKQDIAFTNNGSASMEVYLGNGDGTFQSPTINATNAKPTSIVTGDFNRDGNLDIAVGDSTANNISMFLGAGNGTFTSSTVSTLNFPVSMAVADMNGDGIPDIVNVNPNFDDVTVLLGNGDGTFTTRWQFATGPGTLPDTCNQNPPKAEVTGAQPWAVAIGDFNLDGKPDVVTANTTERCNLTIPFATSWYQPPLGATLNGGPVPSTSVLLNGSGSTTSMSISPSGNIQDNQTITFTGLVTPFLSGTTPTPAGSMQFEDTDGTPLGSGPVPLSGGSASLSLINLGSGTHTITAQYSGDTNYQSETQVAANLVVTVAGTRVSVTITPDTMSYASGVTVTINVVVYGSNNVPPTGNVSIYFYQPNGNIVYVCSHRGNCPGRFSISSLGGSNSGVTLQMSDPNGVLQVGTYEFYATYNGDSNYQAGSSPNEPFYVTQAVPTVLLYCNPISKSGFYAYSETCYASASDGTIGIDAGTIDFSNSLGSTVTPESIEHYGNNYYVNSQYYAQYTFTVPAADESDPDSDSDYDFNGKVTATYTGSAQYTSATATFCENGCSNPTNNYARRTTINMLTGSGQVHPLGSQTGGGLGRMPIRPNTSLYGNSPSSPSQPNVQKAYFSSSSGSQPPPPSNNPGSGTSGGSSGGH